MRLVVFFISLLMSFTVFAEKHSLGSVAEKLIEGTHIITKLVLLMCVVAGFSMIIIAGSLYQAHRHNPKLVPLGKPVLYVVLGLMIFAIPFLGHFIGETGSTIDIKKRETRATGVQLQDIDAPLEWGKDFDH